jgi:hypothetical protein
MAADLNVDPGRGGEPGAASRPGRRKAVRDAVVLAVVLAGLALLVFRPGGEKPGSGGYAKPENREPMRKGGRKGGAR